MSAHTIDTNRFARSSGCWRCVPAVAARRFISVIAGFSFLGIVLGVATLIIVMAVMNGFRKELFNKILGLDAMCWSTRSAADFRL